MDNQKIMSPKFVAFITSPAGRWMRVAAGLGMITGGLQSRTKKGYTLAALGLLPLAAGALDFCVIGPLLGGAFSGPKMRKALHIQQGHPNLGSGSASWLNA